MPRDKILHFIAGVFISGLVSIVFTPAIGLVAGVLAGAAKEIRDKHTEGATADWLDFVATAGGAATASLLIQIF